MRHLTACAALVAFPALALADTTADKVPPVFQMALPAKITLIAWLPAQKVKDAPNLVDLDLRVEVVLPMNCGDRLTGLLRAGGATLDGPDAYEVVIERRAVGKCKEQPTRFGGRTAIRMRLPDGQTRELQIGSQTLKVARKGTEVTLDGVPPEGDVKGAPPTARPTTLVVGDPGAVKLLSAARDTADPDAARVSLHVTAKWPACAGPTLGLLGRGDASTRFALTRFVPIAVAPLDEPCGGKQASRSGDVDTVVRVPPGKDRVEITVGKTALPLPVGARPPQPPADPKTTAQ